MNVQHYIHRIMDKDHMTISRGTVKVFDKIQHPFTIKTLKKLGIGGDFPNLIKASTGNSYLMRKD